MQPTVEWEKSFGGVVFDFLYCAEQTSDGGYIAVGCTEESDNYYAWLLKVDLDGNEEWSVINYDINGTNPPDDVNMAYVLQTSDGGYIITGNSMVYEEVQGEWIWASVGAMWKTDSTGTTEWIEYYYDTEEITTTVPWMLLEVADGYIASGAKFHYDTVTGVVTNGVGMLMKTDFNGVLEWQKEYDATTGGEDFLSSIYPTDDDGYFLAGMANRGRSPKFWMVKTDGDGNKVWDKTFGGPEYNEWTYVRGCCQAHDGGYVMSGNSFSFGAGRDDLWIVKTDSSGNMEWNKTFGGKNRDCSWSMDITTDGGYVFGVCNNFGGYSGTQDDIWIIKTDDEGNAEWSLLLEKDGVQVISYISETDDGGFIVAGRTGTWLSRQSDGLVMKIASFDNHRPDKPSKPSGSESGKTGNEYLYTVSASDSDGDQVYYMWDWGDGNLSDWLGPYGSGETCEAAYTWSHDGSYNIRVVAKDSHGGESDWSDPLPVSMPKTNEDPLWTLIENLFYWLEQLFGRNILSGIA
jgi:hypothetical protein